MIPYICQKEETNKVDKGVRKSLIMFGSLPNLLEIKSVRPSP